MPVGTIDEKWRVTIPKQARKDMKLLPRTPVNVKIRKGALVIVPLRKHAARRKSDSLTWLMEHPAHVNRRKLKSVDLEKLEDEMWLP